MDILRIDNNNESVIKKLKEERLYGMFLAKLANIPKSATYFVIPDKRKSNMYIYYIYWRGYENKDDNGYQAITVFNPVINSEIVNRVEKMLMDNFVGEIHFT